MVDKYVLTKEEIDAYEGVAKTYFLKSIVVDQRLDHDVGDYPRKRKRIYRNKCMKWNLVDFGNIAEPEGGTKV